MPDPITRSLTVPETNTSPGSATCPLVPRYGPPVPRDRRSDLALAGMQPDPKLDPKVLGGVHERPRTADGSGGSVEADDEAIAGGVDLSAPKAPELVTDHPIMGVEQGPPALIAERRRTFGRGGDIREQHGGEDAFDLDDGAFAG